MWLFLSSRFFFHPVVWTPTAKFNFETGRIALNLQSITMTWTAFHDEIHFLTAVGPGLISLKLLSRLIEKRNSAVAKRDDESCLKC